MADNQDCKKVNSLISLYIDGHLDEEKMLFVQNHLQGCKECNEKYLKLKKLLQLLKESYEKVTNKKQQQFFNIREYEFFEDHLNEFIDGELNEIDTQIIQMYIDKTQIAQRKYAEAKKMNALLNNQFVKIKQEIPIDFSKQIVYDLKNDAKVLTLPMRFYKTVAVLLGVFVLFSAAYFPNIRKYKHPWKPAVKKKKAIYVKAPKKKPENIAGSFI